MMNYFVLASGLVIFLRTSYYIYLSGGGNIQEKTDNRLVAA
jgi:hypothetical protein